MAGHGGGQCRRQRERPQGLIQGARRGLRPHPQCYMIFGLWVCAQKKSRAAPGRSMGENAHPIGQKQDAPLWRAMGVGDAFAKKPKSQGGPPQGRARAPAGPQKAFM